MIRWERGEEYREGRCKRGQTRGKWPERQGCRKGSGPTADAVSSGEAPSISPTTQACEANSRAPDTPEQWMMELTLIANFSFLFLSTYCEPNSRLSTFPVLTTPSQEF